MSGATIAIQGILATTANDTFIQSTITTGLTGSDNTAFRIKELMLDYPALAMTANQDADVQLTRGPKAAIANFSDASLIFKDGRSSRCLTSGGTVQDRIKDVVPQGDLIIVEQQIYLGWKTAGFAALATIGYKLVLEEIKISADTRIAILSSRLP